LATPKKSLNHALIATLFSVIGGLLGYLIGMYFIELIRPWILASSYASSFQLIQTWFENSGVWMVILAGFTPIPYKLFTITAGAMHMNLVPFIIGSVIGRGLRFFMVCGLLYYTGERMEAKLRRFIDVIGWAMLAIIVIAFCLIKWVF
jgi:membrane protein YqaA with SNARE-associated domain